MKIIARYHSIDSYAKQYFPWHLPLSVLTHVFYSRGKFGPLGFEFADKYADFQRYYIDQGDDWNNVDTNVVRGNLGQFLRYPNVQIIPCIEASDDYILSGDFSKFRIKGFECLGNLPNIAQFAAMDFDLYVTNDTLVPEGIRVTKICKSTNDLKIPYIIDLDVSNCILHGTNLSLSAYKDDPYIEGVCFSNIPNCDECRSKIVEFANSVNPSVSDPIPISDLTPSTPQLNDILPIIEYTQGEKNETASVCKCICSVCCGCVYKDHHILPWSVGCFYREKVIVEYQNIQYESLKDHHAKMLWTPDFAKSLWRKLT